MASILLHGASVQKDGTRAGAVKPLQPKILPKSFSQLRPEEIGERLTEKRAVEVDLRKPESSAWLGSILKEVQSNDPEARSFALFRLRAGLNSMVLTKGHALSAGLAAYVLEQGVLDEIRRILKAAQSEGDFYILPKIRSQDRVNRTKYFVVSKVDICFRLLHVLILDTRTARFVLKGIPDLILFLEGAYFSLPAVSPIRESGFVPGSAYLEGLRDDDRLSALEVLVSLASYSDRAKEKLCSREVLLHQILRDCMAEREFCIRVLDCALHCFSNLSSMCDLSEYLGEIIGVVLKTLAETQTAALIFVAIHLLASVLQKGQAEAVVCELHQLGGSGKAEHLFPALFALAACPALDGNTKLRVCVLLASLNKRFNETILEERPTESLTPTQQEKLEKLVRSCPGAMARREQLREIFAAHETERSSQEAASSSPGISPSLFQKAIDTPLNFVPDKAHVSYIPEEDLDAHKRPCRKCSCASCSNVESTSREFKVCSGCRLTIYCSRDCQKIAWKEGHKLRCQAGTGEKRPKAEKDASK